MTTTATRADGAQRRADARRLLRLARPTLPPLAASFVFRVLTQLCGLGLLGVAAWGVAGVVSGDPDAPSPGRVVALLVALAVGKGVTRYLEQLTGHTVAFRALAILRVFFFQRLEPQAPAAVDGRRTGDLLARVTRDVDRVEVFFAHTLVPAVTALVTPVLVLVGVAVWAHPALALVAGVAWVCAGLVVPRWRAARSAALARDLRLGRGDLAQHVSDTVQGAREILAFDAADRRLRELDGLGEATGSALRGAAAAAGTRNGASTALVPLTLLTLTWVGAGLVADGATSWSALVVTLAVVLGGFPAVLAVEGLSSDLDQAFASARRVLEVTDAPPATADPAEPRPLPGAGPYDVTFAGVTFAYPGTTTRALEDVDLTIPAGATTALVGASGAGKSTVTSLLLRAWDPDAGTVHVGGTDVRELALADLRRCVAVVPQRPYLFNDTLEANLRLARPDATQDELDDACARAHLTDVVADLPDGYATRIGEQGARLSGGQRQRVAIARAFLQDAPVIVLDEATSQLDATTQALVQAAVTELARGRTVIQVAHRLETVRDVEQIVVLDQGRVVERGTHAELVAAAGAYARLLERERDVAQ